jgi:putative ABC transport system substrate-binding protein
VKRLGQARSVWQGLLLLCLIPVCASAQPRGKVLIVVTSAAGPYGTALAGLRAGLAGQTMATIDLSAAAPLETQNWIRAHRPAVVVAVGSKATLAAVAAAARRVPVISAMVLGWDGQAQGAASVLGLEPAAPRWLERLAGLFPHLRRLGLLAGHAIPPAQLDAIEAEAVQMGYSVRKARCAGVQEALAAIAAMAGNVDLIWCAPDSTLFNETTVKPLLLAALQRQVPLIGFSEAFVRAGAAAGFFADFEDIGLRAAEVAQRVMGGGAVPAFEPPRIVKVAVNERVVRLLGLRHKMADPQKMEALVIQ